jgi:hypothetical protein
MPTLNALTLFALPLTLLAGAALVLLPYLGRTPTPPHPQTPTRPRPHAWARLRHWLAVRFRYPELGGYVHDTAVSQFIPPGQCHYVTGTYTDAAGSVAGTIIKNRAAADSNGVITIPICPLQNGAAQKGSYLKSVDVWYEVTGAALDANAVAAVINAFTLPANGAAFPAASAQAFSYDAGHDTAAERDDLDEHKMTLTLTAPFWLDDDALVLVELTVDSGASSVFKFHGARANYTLRL